MVRQEEVEKISDLIKQRLSSVLAEYDFGKYPASPYSEFRYAFTQLGPTELDIENALKWKWGHWGKPNFPQHHQNLINEIKSYWRDFASSGKHDCAANTYQWWASHLNRSTTYITAAFITHLIHHQEPLPIIDQHNFRAMNHLILDVRPGFTFKRKPSQWKDIQMLKHFMQAVCKNIPGLTFSDLDKFLMMYGRNHVAH